MNKLELIQIFKKNCKKFRINFQIYLLLKSLKLSSVNRKWACYKFYLDGFLYLNLNNPFLNNI